MKVVVHHARKGPGYDVVAVREDGHPVMDPVYDDRELLRLTCQRMSSAVLLAKLLSSSWLPTIVASGLWQG